MTHIVLASVLVVLGAFGLGIWTGLGIARYRKFKRLKYWLDYFLKTQFGDSGH